MCDPIKRDEGLAVIIQGAGRMKKERECCSDKREIKKRRSCKIAEITGSDERDRSKIRN